MKGLPSCQMTPWCNGNVSSVPSSFHDHPVARSGTIDARLFCGTCWSNITRLLKTPIIGRSETIVASSWIDMLAGLSGLYIFRMPPCFWATPAPAANTARSNEPAAANPRRLRFISVYLPWLSKVCPAASRLRTPTKPAVAPAMLGPFVGLSWRASTLERIPPIRSGTSASRGRVLTFAHAAPGFHEHRWI